MAVACDWLQRESSSELQTCSHCCLPSSRHQNPEHAACTEQPPHSSPHSTWKQYYVRRSAAWKDSWGSSTLCSVVLFISVFLGWRRKKYHLLKAQLCSPALGTTHQVKRYCECILTTYSVQRAFTLAFLCSCKEPFQDNSSLYLFESCHCGRVICFLYCISGYIYIILSRYVTPTSSTSTLQKQQTTAQAMFKLEETKEHYFLMKCWSLLHTLLEDLFCT